MKRRGLGFWLSAIAWAGIVPGLAFAAEATGGSSGKIIITGASGGLAGETIEALLARGVKASDLILVSRTPEKLSKYASQGATVRQGDFNKPETLPAAFAGGTRMLLISTSGGDRVTQHTNAINAAKKAGVQHIAYTSWAAVENNPQGSMLDHKRTEDALRASGLKWTMLRNQLYSNGLVNSGAQAIARGEIVTNTGDGKYAPVARTDCAAAAAAVLSTTGHENKVYNITGPELISDADFAKLLTEISGKPVKVVQLTDEQLIERMTKAGMPAGAAQGSAAFGASRRKGELNVISNDVEKLTGKKPQSVRELLLANKDRLLSQNQAR